MNPERFRQIEELYHSAREREPGQRGAFLAEACGGDEELRCEVESLLAQDGVAGPMEQPPLRVAAELLGDATVTQVAIGTQLGPYRIEAPLGAGGMGEVYRAVDTRVDRKVAIKISNEKFSDRFEREKRTIAALNHPHICTLYDVGPNYLVMELVAGETLAVRLKKGLLPMELVLRYGSQIADALAAAHAKGIIHRDLKPGNIMVTKSGVKVLDFGLSKTQRDEKLTVSRAIMGTPAYMAPEQSEGKECDARTDIYALGLVLREMATGNRDGATLDLPLQLAHVIDRCLATEPESRWDSAKDVKLELQWVGPSASPPRPIKLPWAVAGVLVILLIAVGALLYHFTRPAPLRPLMSLSLDLAEETPLANGRSGGDMLALSPDGSRLALTLRGADGNVRLYTRLLNQNQVAQLPGTEDASSPFFSPDGEWIGFWADGKLKKISVQGGAAVTLCEANLRGASWGDDGNIIASLNNFGGLSRVPSSGGTPVPVTKLNPGEATQRWPQVLPGSQAVLFTASTRGTVFDDATIEVVSLKTGERKTVQRGGFSARYVPGANGTGHLIYLHGSTLFAVPFDPGRLALAGVPAAILEDVSSNGLAGGNFDFAGAPSGPGTFVYLAGKALAEGWPISWLDSVGKSQPLHAPLGVYWTLRFSPDGKRLAFATQSSRGEDIWVKDLDRDTPSRLSFFAGRSLWPVWTPDGKNIVFQSTNPAGPGLYWIRSDGSGEPQRLTDGKLDEWPYSFSPDGKRLAFSTNGNGGSPDIFTAAVEGDDGRGASGVRLGKPELFQGTLDLSREARASSHLSRRASSSAARRWAKGRSG